MQPKEQTTKSAHYLDFIRTRPCSLCGNPCAEPHHAIKRLPGVSEARLAQKGSDCLTIPLCHLCHTKLHRGRIAVTYTKVLEYCLINLICYLKTNFPFHKQDQTVVEVCQRADVDARAARKDNPGWD